jgi:hypothetical protein
LRSCKNQPLEKGFFLKANPYGFFEKGESLFKKVLLSERNTWGKREIRETTPTNAEDLRHSVFRRKTSEVFNYDEQDCGKRVFYAACYENAKGEAGPWSDIIEAIIP